MQFFRNKFLLPPSLQTFFATFTMLWADLVKKWSL